MVSKEIPVPPGCRSHFGPLSTCPGAARFLVCVLGVHVPSLLLRKLPVMGGAFVSLGGWCSLATPVLGCRTRKHFAQGVTLAPHRPALPSAQLASFFGALDSVLKYRATITQAFRDMDRFTVNETVLSTKDVLILLHKWSLIGRDTALQEDLRAAIEKYQVKELLTAAAFLVSLYIKDIWLGAQRPDTLLTHVRMVCDSAEDVPSGNKEAIFMLCRDLTTSAPDA
ncbi:nucleolar pre-ribosomal-associated protein 1-like isoform X2 [Manis javanica]|uniref:nucleolar pre-ribosomal-associated protein 1-like isoform X2 n=1 Tax=Manis javanica TaxID=9974 RepID=UPI003C6D1505